MQKNKLSENKAEIEALVKMSQEGDHLAFAKLYDLLIDPIYRYVFYRVNDADAEDLVENVFLKVWQNLPKYSQRKGRYFTAWVFRIAHNLVVDYYRASKDKKVDELSDLMPDTRREHSPIVNAERSLNNQHLKAALSKLKKPFQEVLIYKFINDLSNAEIAEILKKSEGSIRIIQFRALKALKSELKHMGIRYEFL